MRGREEKVILPTATESSQTNRRLIAIARESFDSSVQIFIFIPVRIHAQRAMH